MLAAAFDLEAVRGERGERASKSATTIAVWPRGGTAGDSVGIRWTCVPAAFQPDVFAQGRRRLDALEAEQLPELDRALDVGRRDLDPDVVQHQNASAAIRQGADHDVAVTR